MRGLRGWLSRTTGGLSPTFWYLWTGTLINRLGGFVLIFLAIYLTRARGFSPSYAGLVVGLMGAGGALGTVLGGVLADRWGRRRTLLAANLSTAASLLLLGMARDRYAILAATVAYGLTSQAVRPAFAAMMTDVVPARDRMRAFSLNYWAINLGFAFSAVLAGAVAQVNYLLLFVIDAGSTLAMAALVFLRVPETRPDLPGEPGGRRGGRPRWWPRDAVPRRGAGRAAGPGLGAVFTDRVFLGYVLLNMFMALVFLQHQVTLPIAMTRDGLSTVTYGSVIALNGVLIVAGQLFIPRLVRGRDSSRILAAGSVVTGLGFGATALAHTTGAYAATVLVWTIGEMMLSPANSTLIAELSPLALRGRYQGVFALSWSVAAFGAPVFGSLVQQHLGGGTLWLACGVVGLLAAAAQAASGPVRNRRMAALRAAEAGPVAGAVRRPAVGVPDPDITPEAAPAG